MADIVRALLRLVLCSLTVRAFSSNVKRGLSTLCHIRRALGSRTEATFSSAFQSHTTKIGHTFDNVRNEAMRRAVDQRAFSGNADCSENIVASTHDLSYTGFFKYFNSLRTRSLQLVLEDYEAYQIKITLRCLTLHLLQRCPVVRNAFRRASYHTEAFMGVEAEKFLVICWNCTTSVLQQCLSSRELTAFRSADFLHTFRSALHIDACIALLSLRNNNARSA